MDHVRKSGRALVTGSTAATANIEASIEHQTNDNCECMLQTRHAALCSVKAPPGPPPKPRRSTAAPTQGSHMHLQPLAKSFTSHMDAKPIVAVLVCFYLQGWDHKRKLSIDCQRKIVAAGSCGALRKGRQNRAVLCVLHCAESCARDC
jgi:hypothetical protein